MIKLFVLLHIMHWWQATKHLHSLWEQLSFKLKQDIFLCLQTLNSLGKYGHIIHSIQLGILIVIRYLTEKEFDQNKNGHFWSRFLNSSIHNNIQLNSNISLRIWHLVVQILKKLFPFPQVVIQKYRKYVCSVTLVVTNSYTA